MKKNVPLQLCFLISLTLIQITYQKFLQFNAKSNCLKAPMSSLGLLISLAENNGYNYESQLSEAERQVYLEIVNLKRSFSSATSYIPQSFAPETKEYWKKLNFLVLIFIVIAFFPFIFIIFYFIVRFCCKKCTGPKKVSQVTKVYRNLTWVIMVLSTVSSGILFAIALDRSVKVGKRINNTLNFAVDTISKTDNTYSEIKELAKSFEKKSVPTPPDALLEKFKINLEHFNKNTKDRTNKILEDESTRTKLTIIVFAVYYFLIIMAIVSFFFRWEKIELLVSILLFFFIPGIFILEGFNAKFFFFYGDICDSVSGALYENKYPVADQSLGYYYNCFNTETKSSLYNIRYRLYENSQSDTSLTDEFNKLNEQKLSKIFKCETVAQVIPKMESEFCKDSLNDMYILLLLMTWIMLLSLGVAIGARRLQVLIWKKNNEIESMIQNQEVLY